MIYTEATWSTLAESLLSAAYDRMTESSLITQAGLPSRVCVVPGSIAWDECPCGQLAIAVTRTYPSAQFPRELGGDGLTDQTQCGWPYMIADLTVQAVRCAPSPNERGEPPSCDALAYSSQIVLADAHAVMAGIRCKLADLESDRTIEDYVIRPTTFIGPQGGCVGSELGLTVGVNYGCGDC